MKLIVGLGNPGRDYDNTRHNMGFMTIDSYLDFPNYKEKFNSLYYIDTIKDEKVLFIKPQTFMNNSGDSVVEFVNYYKIDLIDVLVIHDDLDINVGCYKLKISSSDGGHNGIKSIINRLNSNDFCRLKIGIKTDIPISTVDYVLGRLSKSEKDAFNNNMPSFKKIIDSYISNGIDKTMNIYNTKER